MITTNLDGHWSILSEPTEGFGSVPKYNLGFTVCGKTLGGMVFFRINFGKRLLSLRHSSDLKTASVPSDRYP